MIRARAENDETHLDISSSLQASPLAFTIFLDALAELIAEAILEEITQGTFQGVKNTSSATANTEVPQC